MRKNTCVTPVHEKSMIIWNLNSQSLLCRGLNQILMATLSNTSTFCEKIFLRWNAACSEISIFKMKIIWIFYNAVVRSGNIKKGLSAEYAASKHFLICICLMFVCSISSFPKQLLVHSFINWDLRLNMQQVNGVSSSFVFSVRFLFISISANHNKLRKHLTAHLRFSRGIINFPERYNQLVNGV